MIMTTDSSSQTFSTGAADAPDDLALFEIPSAFASDESNRNLIDILESGLGAHLQCSILPRYLGKRRWFAAKDQNLASVRIACLTRLPGTDLEMVLSEVEIEGDGKPGRWLLPLSVVWGRRFQDLTKTLALARIRGRRREGLLTDGYSLAEFAQRMLECLATGAQISATQGMVVFAPGVQADDRLKVAAGSPVTWLSAEQSNSSLIVGDTVMLKIFRRISAGQHPEVEMSQYLTEKGFGHTPLMLGEVARIDDEGERYSLAVAQAFVVNQGDAWTWTLDRFSRFLEKDASNGEFDECTRFAAAMGHRLGEMHVVLSAPTDNEAFSARCATGDDVESWIASARSALHGAFQALNRAPDEKAPAAEHALLSKRDAIFDALEHLAASGEGSAVSRIHGDFHLGQVLVADGDAYIIDFEGEPSAGLAERRRKSSPLNDVAGLLRSFDYALAMAVQSEKEGTLPASMRRQVLAPIVDRAKAVFLQAYRSSAANLSGLDDADLLDLFLIRKAAYEIAYEAANRPEWLPLPVNGLVEIMDRVLGRRTGAAR
jgi:maltose alpha-D-glucosyltransferase / alpha-amylase